MICGDNSVAQITREVVIQVIRNSKSPKILVKGLAIRPDSAYFYGGKIFDAIKEWMAYDFHVELEDPIISDEELFERYKLHLIKEEAHDYDAVVIGVMHSVYKEEGGQYWDYLINETGKVFMV